MTKHCCLQVALYPADRVSSPRAEYGYAGNVQIASILGAEVFPVDTSEEEVMQAMTARGKRPYSIPPGASLHPLGGLGFARWAFEVIEQEKQLGKTFDTIVAAVGSGSTIAGMIAGFKLAAKHGLDSSQRRFVGISIGHTREEAEDLVLQIARTVAPQIGLVAEDITKDDFEIHDDYIGPAYGVLDNRTEAGIKEVAETEGILLDPVYTGKAFTGLLGMARNGAFTRGNILFCHTGGQPALSAYPQLK
jgi:1-aminocyclopropane-1-carboxylate deaminase